MTRRVEILDTTLREGEQTPGVIYRLEDKLEIARLLDAFGIDLLEVGHPAVSASIERHARMLTREGLACETLAHARAVTSDIEQAASCDADWVGIFFSVSDAALENRFRKDLGRATELIVAAIELAKAQGLKVRYTPEDTVRTPIATVLGVARAAVEAGADRISIADTAGCMTPTTMQAFTHELVAEIPVPLHVHCHNDLDLAVANSLAAVQAGAMLVDTTVNGLGERCGITPLAPLATALVLQGLAEPRWDLSMLPAISDAVSRATGIPVPVNGPIVGANAFSHNAGLHVAAVLQDPSHYEFIPAHVVGRQRHIVLDTFSGRAAVRFRLEQAGIEATDALVDQVLHVVKGLEATDMPDDELRRLVRTIELARSAPTGSVRSPPSTPEATPR